jgi:hypothetical protein
MSITCAVHVIDDRLYALVIFEAAVVGTPIRTAIGSDIAAFHTHHLSHYRICAGS